MAESSVVASLMIKRDEMEKAIVFMEGKLAEMRANLVHVNAVLHMYEGGPTPKDPTRFQMRLGQVFSPGEYVSLALAILREHGPMNTSELAAIIIQQKGWSSDDLLLKRSLIKRLGEMLKKALARRKIGSDGVVRNVRVWRLP